MRIKKNGKVITLTESDLNRIVKKVLNEQEKVVPGAEKDGTSKIAPMLQDYVDNHQKMVSLVTALKSIDELGDKAPFAIGRIDFNQQHNKNVWDANLNKWRNNKDKNALAALDKMIKDNMVKIYPFNTQENSGSISGLKYVYKSPTMLKIVSA